MESAYNGHGKSVLVVSFFTITIVYMLCNVVTDLFLAEVCKYELGILYSLYLQFFNGHLSVYIYIQCQRTLYNVWGSALGTQQSC